MIPSGDHTGVPLHFHSSTTSGSASLMRVRSRESVSPRQSPSSLILASINSDGDPGFSGALFFTTSLSYHIDFKDAPALDSRSARIGEDDANRQNERLSSMPSSLRRAIGIAPPPRLQDFSL